MQWIAHSRRKGDQPKTTWWRNMDAEMNNMQHNWGAEHRLAPEVGFVDALQDTTRSTGQ